VHAGNWSDKELALRRCGQIRLLDLMPRSEIASAWKLRRTLSGTPEQAL
jgi:hypothetical protein